MPIPGDLQQRLDEYLDTLPFYQRWPLKAAFRLFQPKAGALGCLVIVFIIIIVAWGIIAWADGCASGRINPALCP